MNTSIPIIYGLAVTTAVVFYSLNAQAEKENTYASNQQTSERSTNKNGLKVSKQQGSTQVDTSENSSKQTTIPADPKIHKGTLANGMKYIIYRNMKPEKRASMRLYIGAGSLNEEDDQRGLAHFLEHMVFNGSKNHPDAKKLIPKMQRLGISFGAHANAYTSFDRTVYMFDLPNTEDSTLDLAFSVMQDFAGGALLSKSEIDEERGVILAEKTSRDSVQSRIQEQQFKFLLPESKLIHRFPIGTEEVIKTIQRDRFVDFYQKFYRPNNMCFVYVGDIDVTKAEEFIKSTFQNLKKSKNQITSPEVGKITTGKGFQSAVFADKELTTTDISLVTVKEYTVKADTIENRVQKLPMIVASQALSRRFSELSLEENSPILSGSAYKSVFFKAIEFGSVDVSAKNNNWQKALPVLVTEFKRAKTHGFTKNEIEEVKASLLNQYEQAVKSAPSQRSPDIATALIDHHHNQLVYSTAETDLTIIKKALDSITPESCHEAFKKFWNTEDLHLILTSSEANDEDKKLLTSLYEEIIQKDTEAPVVEEKQQFAYTKLGLPGKVVSTVQVPDLKITQLTLSNGIRVNLKKTDFEVNSVSMTARIQGGSLTLPKDKAGLSELADTVMNIGGLGKHSMNDLRGILAGKSVGWVFSTDRDAFTVSGATTPENLTLQLQLLVAAISDPGYRPEAERLFKAQLPQIYKQLNHTIAGGRNAMSKTLASGDPRFFMPEQKQIQQLKTEDVKNWITPYLTKGALELSIVGDIDIPSLTKLLEETVGTLPQRNPLTEDQTKIELNKLSLPIKKHFHFESKVPTSVTMIGWRTEKYDAETIGKVRRLNVLASILSDRMRIKLREDLGQTYSPGAYSSSDNLITNNSYIYAYCSADKKDVDELSEVILNLAENLSQKGATQDELDRALKPQLASLEKTLKQNSYWLGTVIDGSQAKPYQLDWCRNRDKDYQKISLEEINALAKKYLTKKNTATFIITPQ